MFENELLLGRVLFAPVGLNKDSGLRRLLGRAVSWTGPGLSQLIILGRSPQYLTKKKKLLNDDVRFLKVI